MGMKEFKLSNFKDALELAFDLNTIGNVDAYTSRMLVKQLLSEGKSDWLSVLLSETKGTANCDSILESALFEFPVALRGYAGKVEMTILAGHESICVMAFQIKPHREGMIISPENALKTPYSERISELCYSKVMECMAELSPVDAILRGGELVVADETLSFLNGMVIGNSMTTVDTLLQLIRKDHGLKLSFKPIGKSVLINASFLNHENKLLNVPSWGRLKKIKEAGSASSLGLSNAVSAPEIETEALPEKVDYVLHAESRLKDELMFVAQAFEYLRSMELSQIRSSKGNAKLVNHCMLVIDTIQKTVALLQRNHKGQRWVEGELRVILMLMGERFTSSHDLVKRHIDQMPLKQRRLTDAFLSYKELADAATKDSRREKSL
jgi:hypothetical protein